ncbi:MAG: hypothetical protein K0B81_00385 [Candidatus Cloacimonetes bacterium]|nr:hypothetical protein [Candidatus Cloacimonadota bacterium]
MKQTPNEKTIQERLKPGVITLDGFLGEDNRHYHDIINEDMEKLKSLNITKEDIADRMQYFTDLALMNNDEEAVIDDIYKVHYLTERGKIVSPFMDRGLIAKGSITLHNMQNDLKVCWTPLNISMIRNHGFFEGKGATHRLEPEILVKAIF